MPEFMTKPKYYALKAIQRMVRHAAENGYDSIAWTPGEVQADRYDLSKQVDRIKYYKYYENEWDKAANAVNTAIKERLSDKEIDRLRDVRDGLKGERDKKGEATGLYSIEVFDKNKQSVFNEQGVKIGRIEELVGKEIAEKLAKSNRDSGTLSGLDLKVGGEGMKGFYDKILPADVNKFFNKAKWGKAKVGTTELILREGDLHDPSMVPDPLADDDLLGGGPIPDTTDQLERSKTGERWKDTKEVWTLPITPEMKSKALYEGMPQFTFAGAGALTAETSELNRAGEMEAAGTDMETIRKETGWYLWHDSKWRFEIDDSKATIDRNAKPFDTTPAGSDVYRLGDYIKHPDLYKAYPQLADYNIELLKGRNVTGVFGSFVKYSPTFKNNNPTIQLWEYAGKKSTLIHEIQHAVQEIEGFARGGSPERLIAGTPDTDAKIKEAYTSVFKEWAERIKGKIPKGERERKISEIISEAKYGNIEIAKLDAARFLSTDEYKRLAGEIESREVSDRMDLTPEQRKAKAPFKDGIPKEDVIVRFDKGPQFSTMEQVSIRYEPYAEKRGDTGPFHDAWVLTNDKGERISLKRFVSEESAQRQADRINQKDVPQFSTTAIGGKDIVTFKETTEPVTQADFDANRETSTDVKMKTFQALRRAISGVKLEIEKTLAPISTRIARINMRLMAKVRGFDIDINLTSRKDLEKVIPLFKKTRKMSKADAADWAYARDNSVTWKINELMEKYDSQKEYAATRTMIDGIKERAFDVGLSTGEIEDYWPRLVKDLDGLFAAMDREAQALYTRRIQDKAIEMGISVSKMNPDIKAGIITDLILGGPTGLGGPTATKARKFKKIPPKLMPFYHNPDAALVAHIYEMNKAIEKRKFFGKIPEKVAEMRRLLYAARAKIRTLNAQLDEGADVRKRRNKWIGREMELQAYINAYALQRDYTDNIGAYIDEMRASGDIDPSKETELNDILKARFHERGTHGIVQTYKNFSYMDTMGSPISALTQIGDMAWAMYDAGIIPALKHGAKSLVGKSRIKKADVGQDRIAQEFADPGTLGKAVSFVFKMVGLEKIDAIGKEALLNASLERYQKEAKSNPEKLSSEIKHIFEGETNDVIQDLLDDSITDNVKLLVYHRLMDFQPGALSEMPQRYLDAGNGRI
ncbi:MAG: LPD23 domain-containing protein, partial [Candidatus Margulisiibacteriota bacterium]